MKSEICGQGRLCLLLTSVLMFRADCPLHAEFRFTVTGDPRSSYPNWEWTLSEMAGKVGDEGVFHITAGDYYEDGAATTASGFYNRLKTQFGDDVVWYPTVGNHELEEGGPDMVWLRNFYYTNLEGTVNPGPTNGVETNYSWDYQNAHFVQLNQYYDGTTDDADIDEYTDALYEWLLGDLDRNTKPVVFVIYHEPAWPNGRGDKDSPVGWERFLKLLNDRKVVAGICADTHTYARYQVDGDWETFTWELDAGNAGRTSHGDLHQTFVDITVYDNAEVQFVTWQGMENEEFTVTDSWVATAMMATLNGPPDGATVDTSGAVLSCDPVAGAQSYQLLFGPDSNRMVYLASHTNAPPTAVISEFPFAQTWWTVRALLPTGHKVYGVPRHLIAESVAPVLVENITAGHAYSHIQPAVDDANNGDDIVIRPSPWQHLETVDLHGKNLTLRCEDPDDPAIVASTVINGGDKGPAVSFSGADYASPLAVLTGLTLTGGTKGIYVADACPLISKCNIVANRGPGIEWAAWLGCRNPVITNCTVTANQGPGILFEGRTNPRICNCVISGNLEIGLSARGPFVYNCAVVGNGLWGISTVGGRIGNCIVRDNAAGEIQGAPVAGYSNVKGGWVGEHITDADPCFVTAGFWDSNGLWVEGNYRLRPVSTCVDAGDNAAVPADTSDLDGDGNTVEPLPLDLDGRPRFVDHPDVADTGNGTPPIIDLGPYEASMPPVEVFMKFTPQSLNPGSRGNWVKVHFVLPQEFSVGDVDTNSPARIIEPFSAESQYMNVFVNEESLVEIEAAFDRLAFCSSPLTESPIEVVATLAGTEGRYFRGTDTVRVINKTFEYLAGLACHWLDTGCAAPDWCAGFDFDGDSTVDFADFTFLDGCCIEISNP